MIIKNNNFGCIFIQGEKIIWWPDFDIMKTVTQWLQCGRDIQVQGKVNLDVIGMAVEGDIVFFENGSQVQHVQGEELDPKQTPVGHHSKYRKKRKRIVP